MAFQEITNPGLIDAGDESQIRPIVANPPGLPPATNPPQAQIPAVPIADAISLPVTTNPPQRQLPSVGAPANVNIK